MKFSDFNFEESLQEGLDSMGFENPTPIQEQAIPIIQNNKDLIGCAQTGTGKTAAFLLPILNKLAKDPTTTINTLIIVPTRELALQIDQALQGFSYFTSVSSLAIYGGSDGSVFEIEKRALTEGANIIIATPGRLMAHLNMGYVKLDSLETLILDEADRMLDMGFVDDILKITTYLPKQRQTLMFSATMPPKIRTLATKLLQNPEHISIAVSKPAEGVIQGAYLVYDTQKNNLIKSLLEGKDLSSVIIFVSTKLKVKELERDLQKAGLKAKAIHSDLEQPEREEVLRNFRSKKLQILVATDILSRGIDIEDIGLVINYDVPGDAEDYIHRIGRTARAASTGVALTFINEYDQQKFLQIETMLGSEVKKIALPENVGVGPAYTPEVRMKKPFSKGKKPFSKNRKPVRR
ncbi:MAG: ATP-dependent RNA helicase [Bacteroidetes bacterium RIFCSPLOWO2_12_FULL_35_15]|nr:MAG: ATP-dependent RNA helicase [Bacteroidetes bacterium RIFCSPLOWO2_12_FULL_35_15]